ncbi:MFS transporter [Streptomyces sp. NPDC017988]|uniref:MFS transporter n=1 Tax=Streptomyces sp. NPDC017988 TaxID=3365025 RepID=UPI0037A42781
MRPLVLPTAAAPLSAGVFGDLYGRRRIFSPDLALTGTGGLAAAPAGLLGRGAAMPVLWAGEAVSGLGAGLVLPTTPALIAHAVPDPHDRGHDIGLWAAGVAAGLALGPLVSGGILESGAWAWIFAPASALSFGTLVYGHLRLPESKSPEGRRLDWPGQITASLAVTGLIFGVIEGGSRLPSWPPSAAPPRRCVVPHGPAGPHDPRETFRRQTIAAPAIGHVLGMAPWRSRDPAMRRHPGRAGETEVARRCGCRPSGVGPSIAFPCRSVHGSIPGLHAPPTSPPTPWEPQHV